jgi:predicted nucleotide-binding protein (sugar kinase/HSP70/actin superfamily)
MDSNQEGDIMMVTNVQIAKFSDNHKYIIDSEGQKVKLNDPRVMHIWAVGANEHAGKMTTNVFCKQGWRAVYTGKTSNETLQYARNLISGRECLPFAAIVGAAYRDIVERRPENEISVYYILDQEGPCQNGAWPLICETFAKRLGKKNIVFCAYPTIKNNYIGGPFFAVRLTTAFILGALLEEAEMVLKVLAKDKEFALKVFQKESDKVIESIGRSLLATELSLKKWAKAVAAIPLKNEVKKTPKVLLFGGGNVLHVHYPVSEYFVGQGVIPKVIDTAEFISWIESELVTRHGVKRGVLDPQKQYKYSSILVSLFNPKNKFMEVFRALRSMGGILGIDYAQKRYRKIAEKSGLLYDAHTPFIETLVEAHKYISTNDFCETPANTGKFLATQKTNVYDGYINLGSFNCQPAMNTQALLRTISSKYDVPYASLDCEGPNISANQKRLLETIAVQAKRLRAERNKLN